MTYCVGAKLNGGLVFLSDSRTNAGVDNVSKTKKMTIFRSSNDRTFVLLSAGNLAITQSVKELLSEKGVEKKLWNSENLYKIAEIIGDCIRAVKKRDGMSLQKEGVKFDCSFILGGQIKDHEARLFKIYSAGNFIEAEADCLYFQIGETKYGKPILDRVLTTEISLESATKCVLLSMDSTLRSNVSVGLPLDLFIFDKNNPDLFKYKYIDEKNSFFIKLKESWNEHLEEGFNKIDNFDWNQQDLPINKILIEKS